MTEPSAAKRVVASLPAGTFEKLDALAGSARFGGNRSAALSWCVELGAEVLGDPAVAGRLFERPDDALAAFLTGRKRAGRGGGQE